MKLRAHVVPEFDITQLSELTPDVVGAPASLRRTKSSQPIKHPNFTLYAIDEQGRLRDLPKNPAPGGWQDDAHRDVIHNYVDAIRAFPELRQYVALTQAKSGLRRQGRGVLESGRSRSIPYAGRLIVARA